MLIEKCLSKECRSLVLNIQTRTRIQYNVQSTVKPELLKYSIVTSRVLYISIWCVDIVQDV